MPTPTRKQKVTIHDIARHLDMSASTVSRALNGNTVISRATREAVLAKATELDYRPNGVASALRSGSSKLVGVLIPQANRAFFANIINGVEAVAAEWGYRVLVMQHHNDSARELQYLEELQRLRVDGIVVSVANDGRNDRARYAELLGRGVVIHFVDRVLAGLRAASVVVDDFGGAYAATEHLLGRGYRRVAHLRGPAHLMIYADRERGYRAALADAGVEVDERLILDVASSVAAGREAFARLFDAEVPSPDAVFSASDFSALGFMKSAQDRGLRIGPDLGIVGFMNEPFTEYVTPTLTTVEQHTINMGQHAARRLLGHLADPEEHPLQDLGSLVLSPELVIRESSERLPPNQNA